MQCTECDNPAKLRGYCQRHYDHARYAGDLPAERAYNRAKNGYKLCVICEETKPVTEFNKNGGSGLFTWCKQCQSRIRKERYAANPHPYRHAARRAQIKYLYGITPDQYFKLVEAQGGCCAICHEPATGPTSLHVDHDHRCCPGGKGCGKCIRGLLCISCNALLGQAKDDPQRLEKAIAYLRRADSLR